MAKRKKDEEHAKITRPPKWGVKEMIEDLLKDGAVEIPKEDWDKEPYKTYMKNIKKNGKFICD